MFDVGLTWCQIDATSHIDGHTGRLCYRWDGRHSSTCRPIWMKLGRDLSLHGIHLRGRFDPDRFTGGSRPNENDFVLVIRKICHNSSYIQRISMISRQTLKCLVGLCCCERFRKFITWSEPQPKNGGISGILHTAYVKSFTAKEWYRWKTYTRCQQLQMENCKPDKIFGFGKFISPVLST